MSKLLEGPDRHQESPVNKHWIVTVPFGLPGLRKEGAGGQLLEALEELIPVPTRPQCLAGQPAV